MGIEGHDSAASQGSGYGISGKPWTKTALAYRYALAESSAHQVFSTPGVDAVMVDDEAITQDVVSEQYFATLNHWYASSYGCRSCASHLYKIVFPPGRELEISTDDPANPRAAIKRLFTCAHCRRFVTSAASEEDVAADVRAGAGTLGDPNNFEYQCGSEAEYRDLLQKSDTKGTTNGRPDAGFIRLGKPLADLASVAREAREAGIHPVDHLFDSLGRNLEGSPLAASLGQAKLDGSFAAPQVQPSKSGGCYVATAVYGGYDCSEVWVLRRWRDARLATTALGRVFVRLYYAISPTVVRLVGGHPWFISSTRRPLDLLVRRLMRLGISDAPYEDVPMPATLED